MDNILQRNITVYRNVTDTTGQVVTLENFLTIGLYCHEHVNKIRQSVMCMDQAIMKANNWSQIQQAMWEVRNTRFKRLGKDTVKQKESALRFLMQTADNWPTIKACEDYIKAQKRQLPCATFSGVFNGPHKATNLIRHSGLICIDIDHCDPIQVMANLKQLNIVAYASRSASGKGVFCIVPLAYPDQHLGQYLALEKWFESMGIYIDDACKDVSRLRYASYDPQAFYRPDAVPFTGVLENSAMNGSFTTTATLNPICRKDSLAPIRKPIVSNKNYDYEDTLARANACVQAFESGTVELPKLSYNQWVTLGMALSELGEQGRGLFKRLSRVDKPSVSEQELDIKYSNFLNSTRRMGIASFFSFCSNCGVNGRVEMNGNSAPSSDITCVSSTPVIPSFVSKVSKDIPDSKQYSRRALF